MEEVKTDTTGESMGAGISVADKPFVDPMDEEENQCHDEDTKSDETPEKRSECGSVITDQSAGDSAFESKIVEESENETNNEDADDGFETCTEVSEDPPVQIKQEKDNGHENNNLPSEIVRSGLSLLAQYKSDYDETSEDSDASSVAEVKDSKDYRNNVVEIDSDVESSSTLSSDDSDSDTEFKSRIRKLVDKPAEDDDTDDEDLNSIPKKRQPPRVRGELLLEDLPPIEDLHITVPSTECIELGKVHSIVDQLVLVSAVPNAILLDLDTVLFLENGQKVLGAVFDVLGQVADPLYCVRFNSHEQIIEKGIQVGDKVFVAPKTEYTQYVILSNLIQQRGSDASWENDIEPPPRFLDYSDDEEERRARSQVRQKDHSREPKEINESQKRARTSSSQQSEDGTAMPTTSAMGSHRRESSFRTRQRGFRTPSQNGILPSYHPNFNPSSWHANYYPPISGMYPPTPPNYGAPLPQYFPNYVPQPMYGPPGPMFPQPPVNCVLNPYAIRPSTLQPPFEQSPPPPPGT